jgi:hypothetical protein
MSQKFNNVNTSYQEENSLIPEKIEEPSKVDRTMDIGQEDLTKYKNDNFVESVGIEYQNLMNEMGQDGNRIQSAFKPSTFVENKGKSVLNKPTTIQISSNLDTLEQRIVELRQKRAKDNRMMIEQ